MTDRFAFLRCLLCCFFVFRTADGSKENTFFLCSYAVSFAVFWETEVMSFNSVFRW